MPSGARRSGDDLGLYLGTTAAKSCLHRLYRDPWQTEVAAAVPTSGVYSEQRPAIATVCRHAGTSCGWLVADDGRPGAPPTSTCPSCCTPSVATARAKHRGSDQGYSGGHY